MIVVFPALHNITSAFLALQLTVVEVLIFPPFSVVQCSEEKKKNSTFRARRCFDVIHRAFMPQWLLVNSTDMESDSEGLTVLVLEPAEIKEKGCCP